MKTLLVALSSLLCTGALAQEHPYLSRFVVIEQQAAVRLEWTMIAGNTCVDIEVWRGTDTTSMQAVGTIYGLCGSISDPVAFSWEDPSPPENSILYYRVVLGTAGPSSIQAVDFDQFPKADTRVLLDGRDRAEVFLNVPLNAEVEWRCAAANGAVLRTGNGVGQWHAVDLKGVAAGAFVFQGYAEGRVFTAPFVLP